jgi:hypothetical protein
MQKHIKEKFQNIKQENIEEFFYQQDSQIYQSRYSFAGDEYTQEQEE